MPGATACRWAATRPFPAILLVSAPLVSLAMAATPAHGAAGRTAQGPVLDRIVLPAPIHDVDPLTGAVFNFRQDRLKKSVVPGPTTDREDLTVGVGPTGTPVEVTNTQRLVIHGAGNYVIRELGPAREAVGLGDTVPPVLELGTVVWQGFSPD